MRTPRFDDIFIRLGAIVVLGTDIWLRDWLVERSPSFRLKQVLNVKIKVT